MSKKRWIHIAIGILLVSIINSQNYQWAVQTNPATSYGNAIIKPDLNNNLIVITQYVKPIGMGKYIKCALLAKYSSTGSLLSQDTLKNFFVYDFDVASDHSIYLAGYINEDTSYVANLILKQIGSAFVVRYISNSNATVIINSRDSTGVCYNGQVIGVTRQKSNMFFYGGRNLLPGNGKQIFLVKYNPLNGIINNQVLNGNVSQFSPGLSQDSSGHLYMVSGIGLLKADTSGYFSPVIPVSVGAPYASFSTDSLGNFYYTYSNNGTIVQKFDSAGNLLWSNIFTNSGPGDICADKTGNLYLTGIVASANGVSQFDTDTLNGFGMYIVKLNTANGKIIWMQSIVVPGFWEGPVGTAIYSDGSGNLYAGGGISDTTAFGSTILYSTSGYPAPAGYLIKLEDNTIINSIDKKERNEVFPLMFPNPTTAIFILKPGKSSNTGVVRIRNVYGDVINSAIINGSNSDYQFDLSEELKGVYLVEFETSRGKSLGKILVH